MRAENTGTLFIFFDESGNFDFSPNGTRFWALGALCSYHPAKGREGLIDLGYRLAEEGQGQDCFHATEDKQLVRDRVFGLIRQVPESFHLHFTIAEKNRVPPALRTDDVTFFAYVCKRAIRHLLLESEYKAARRVVVVFSAIFNRPKHEKVLGQLKAELKKCLDVPFWIYFKTNSQDLNCQIADYCCWATYIKWTRNEFRSYDLIADKIRSEVSIFPANSRSYYEQYKKQ